MIDLIQVGCKKFWSSSEGDDDAEDRAMSGAEKYLRNLQRELLKVLTPEQLESLTDLQLLQDEL